MADLSDPRFSFLALGGFVFWARGGVICGVQALTLGEGLHFEGPFPLQSSGLRNYLYDTGRVEITMLESNLECHIDGYCWITPGESFVHSTGEADAHRLWPHGAFIYFSDEKRTDTDSRDCFFRVTSSKPVKDRATAKRSSVTMEMSLKAAGKWMRKASTCRSHEEQPAPAPLLAVQPVARRLSSFGCLCQLFDLRGHGTLLGGNADEQRKAEAHCLLHRCLDESWRIKVIGNGACEEGFQWYRRMQEVDHRVDGSMWVKVEEPADRYTEHKVRLTLMPAKQAVNKRLVTLTENGKSVVRDNAKWRRLKAADLLRKAAGRVLQVSDSFAQQEYGWYLVPLDAELEAQGSIDPPDSSRGKVMQVRCSCCNRL